MKRGKDIEIGGSAVISSKRLHKVIMGLSGRVFMEYMERMLPLPLKKRAPLKKGLRVS